MEAILAIATIVGGIAAFWFFGDKILSAFRSSSVDEKDFVEFLRVGQDLLARSNKDPLPVEERNDWVERMIIYFRDHKRPGYEARLSDFSGMSFYGDGSERSKFKNSIDGRLRRLHEFISELSKN